MADQERNDTSVDEDDEMEYEPTNEEETEHRLQGLIEQLIEEGQNEEEDSEDEYHDAEQDNMMVGHVRRDDDDDEEEDENEDEEDRARAEYIGDPPDDAVQIFYLWARGQLMQLSAHEDDDSYVLHQRRPRERPNPNRFPKVPSEYGIKLMSSGDFGTNETKTTRIIRQQKKVAWRILSRELGFDGVARHKANQNLMAQGMIPSSEADTIIHYDAPVYSGQFSDDGNFFFACVKDYKVRMYDTSNSYKWRYYKTGSYPLGHWTLTDSSLSPDNRYLAYTSICPTVCLAPTDPNDLGDPYDLDLSENGRRGRRPGNFRSRVSNFGIWSIRFSGDGKELIAGTSSNSILVYDIEARRSVLEIPGHDDEVNAVCFANKSSSNILFSGSDDSTIKVWDRRSMADSREAGAFVGHTEGITYIDSKGDGRYCLSNGKDQSMKLWDLRTMMTTAQFAQINTRQYTTNFDYRWGNYNEDEWIPHPYDNSVVTFRGHRVLRTLIRCHFSPPGSTNSRYVYSGSEDGKIYVYNMDATLAGKIDVFEATQDSRPYEAGNIAFHPDDGDRGTRWKTCVRDASWHPNAPIIAASAWNGYGMQNGTVTAHSWNDGAEDDEAEPKMGNRVNDQLKDNPLYYQPSRRNPGRRTPMMFW